MTTEDIEPFSAYSSPYYSLNTDLHETIIIEYAKEYVKRLLTRCSQEVQQSCDNAGEIISDWLNSAPSADTVWHVSFGEIARLARGEVSDGAHERVASLLLRIAESGFPLRAKVQLREPARLRFQNCLLPDARRLILESDGSRCAVANESSGRACTFDRCGSGWRHNSGDACALDLFTIGTGPVVVLNDAATAGFDADGFGAVESIGSEGWVRSSVQAARELLAEASPTYLNWVSRVVRHFVPLKSVGSMIVSGSDPSQPGVIFASPLAGAALAAEVLVHEASHQYMHILCRLGLVDDGDPTPKYYSPVKGTMRPLWGIVTAFHAFANVSLYYREICRCPLTSQMDREYCTVQNEHLMPQLDQLRMSLRDNPALSWIGRALVEPLFQTIDA